MTIINYVSELEKLFDLLNARFFESALSKPVITVMQDTTGKAYGWCTLYKAWQNKDGNGEYEINVCADYLNRPYELIAETLLHEMVHLHNLYNDIKGNSRNGTYHNKRFKDSTEAHGLICEKTAKYGFSKTSLNADAVAFLSTHKSDVFDSCRISPLKDGGKKSSTRKYDCPVCGLSVRSTKEVFVICGECSETMVLDEPA